MTLMNELGKLTVEYNGLEIKKGDLMSVNSLFQRFGINATAQVGNFISFSDETLWSDFTQQNVICSLKQD